jgi:hypothetical protein
MVLLELYVWNTEDAKSRDHKCTYHPKIHTIFGFVDGIIRIIYVKQQGTEIKGYG